MDHDELAGLADRLRATVSHETAAALWGFRVPDPPVLPAVTVARNRSYRLDPAVTFHRRTLRPSERRVRLGVPVTAPLRTCLDLAATRSLEDAVATLDPAVQSRLVKPHQLVTAARDLRGRGAVRVRRALFEADGRSQSIPESLIRVRLASDGRVGRVVPQLRLRPGGHPYDLGLPDLRTVVEFQSWEWHGERAVWARDARWGNEAFSAGWGYVQLVHEDVLRGADHVVDLVLGRMRVTPGAA